MPPNKSAVVRTAKDKVMGISLSSVRLFKRGH